MCCRRPDGGGGGGGGVRGGLGGIARYRRGNTQSMGGDVQPRRPRASVEGFGAGYPSESSLGPGPAVVAGRMRCVEGEMHTRTAGVLSSKLGARVRATKAASNSAHGQPRATNPLTKKSNNNRDRTAHGFLYLP